MRASRWRVGALALTLAAAGAAWSIGCHSAPAADPPNVLLVLVDTLRADHLGAYGYQRPTSPTFDALATRGVLFTRTYSTTSWTNPAIASLFSGERPRVLQPGAPEFIAPQTRTLAQAFHDRGYRTGAIIANPVLPPDLGFAQGFDGYVPVSGWTHSISERPKEPAERANAAALNWLAQSSAGQSRPWFLYLHYMDAHWPYEPPVETARRFWRSTDGPPEAAAVAINTRVGDRRAGVSPAEAQRIVDLYDASVAHFDGQLGRLFSTLEQRGQLSNTIICIAADHGEELGDHGGVQHARTLFEEVLHIPLLIVSPGTPRPERVDRVVQITDVGRTLLDLAGLHDSALPGRSLLSAPQAAATDTLLLAELMPGFGTGTLHEYALLHGTMKLIVTPSGQQLLFDLGQDPGEQHSAAAERPELLAQLTNELAPLAVPHERRVLSPPDAATRERLRALGYDL